VIMLSSLLPIGPDHACWRFSFFTNELSPAYRLLTAC
jgi:hypothetical protein